MIDVSDYKRMRLHELSDEGAQALVQGIVEQAVHDWRTSTPGSGMRTDCERFFLSSWFYMLTGVDGEPILRKLREEERKGGAAHVGHKSLSSRCP